MPTDILSWEEKYTSGLESIGDGSPDKAIHHLKEAVAISEKLDAAEPYMHSMLSLGDAYKISGDYEAANQIYRKVILRASNSSDLRAFAAIGQGALGMLCMGRQNSGQALVELESAVAMIKRLRDQRLPEFAPIIMGLAGVHMELQDFESADKVCRYAYDFAKEVLGPHDACTIATMNLCALCADVLGKPKRAAILRCQIREAIRKMERGGLDQLGVARALPGLFDDGILDKIHFVMDDEVEIAKDKTRKKTAKTNSNVVQFPKTDKRKSSSKNNALEKAEEIVRQAWNLPAKQSAQLAKEAIKLSPDCTNAYLLLAESTSGEEERIIILRQAIDAAGRNLETDWQKKYEGHCWQFVEARPMLRAMALLAMDLQLNDELDEALKLYRQLMKLTPGDNQGVRYQLASCLYEAKLDSELEKLFEDYSDDPSAASLYTKALHLFRKEGASKRANMALLKAFDANTFVPLFLSDIVEMPENPSGMIGFGDENEAAAYINDCGYLWGDTPGAEVWMAEQLEPGMRKSFPDKEMIDAVLIELKLE